MEFGPLKDTMCGPQYCGSGMKCVNASTGLCCKEEKVDTEGICCLKGKINCNGVCCASRGCRVGFCRIKRGYATFEVPKFVG